MPREQRWQSAGNRQLLNFTPTVVGRKHLPCGKVLYSSTIPVWYCQKADGYSTGPYLPGSRPHTLTARLSTQVLGTSAGTMIRISSAFAATSRNARVYGAAECSNHKTPITRTKVFNNTIRKDSGTARFTYRYCTGAIVGDEPGSRITYRFPFPPSSVIPHTVFHILRVSRLCHSSAVTRQTEQMSTMSRPILFFPFRSPHFFFFQSLCHTVYLSWIT